jgi:hypothetical protein
MTWDLICTITETQTEDPYTTKELAQFIRNSFADEYLTVDGLSLTESHCAANVICPFCGDGGFDAPGLAAHLAQGQCEQYDAAWKQFIDEVRKPWCRVCDRPKSDCACVENGGTY